MRINGQYVLVHLPVRRMSKSTSRESLAALTLGAMGVVYGDIGTSISVDFTSPFINDHSIQNFYIHS